MFLSRPALLETLLPLALLPSALAGDVLTSNGFTNCAANGDIKVNRANITFDRNAGSLVFDVAGVSVKSQNVTAILAVTAYGNQVYNNHFNPCDASTHVAQLCPVPAGSFAARGQQNISQNIISQIPSIAFSVPDIDAQATLTLNPSDGNGSAIGCVETGITNGRTFDVPAVSYVAAAIAGAALVLSGLSALAGSGEPGAHAPSVGFATVMGWFQSMQMNGMMSVNYPPVYRSFSKNFAFSGGLIPWTQMQQSIDSFRSVTGGNLTQDNVQYLQNSTLAFQADPSSNSTTFAKRSLDAQYYPGSNLLVRRIETSVNGTGSNGTSDNSTGITHLTHGIAAYAEELMIPQANTFMTVLLIFAIVLAAITVGILLLKVILEAWALFGSFPKRLTGFRKRYWRTLAKTITNLILVFYGVWTLYCIFQFTNGDSWAAKLLAAITLAIFTAILLYFTIRIWLVTRKLKRVDGDVSALFENKETWIRYSIFYDVYKRGYWWIFMPAIIYMFAKGCVLAAGNGHGLTQTAAQLIVESLMFVLLLWSRPYNTKAGNIINIFIQTVRVLSVVCILVFVEQLGIAQTTKTITGVILIAVQAGLTGILAILIAINGLIVCFKENPHRRERKQAEKMNREFDNLTPLDARNTLLLDPISDKSNSASSIGLATSPNSGYPTSPYNHGKSNSLSNRFPGYDPVPGQSPGDNDRRGLVGHAAGMGRSAASPNSSSSSPYLLSRSSSRESGLSRPPTVPTLDAEFERPYDGAPGTYGHSRTRHIV